MIDGGDSIGIDCISCVFFVYPIGCAVVFRKREKFMNGIDSR